MQIETQRHHIGSVIGKASHRCRGQKHTLQLVSYLSNVAIQLQDLVTCDRSLLYSICSIIQNYLAILYYCQMISHSFTGTLQDQRTLQIIYNSYIATYSLATGKSTQYIASIAMHYTLCMCTFASLQCNDDINNKNTWQIT